MRNGKEIPVKQTSAATGAPANTFGAKKILPSDVR